MAHRITLDYAVYLTTNYRTYIEDVFASSCLASEILANAETFDAIEVRELLSQPDTVKLRIYYGMEKDKKVVAVLVGVDSNDRDMTEGIILQDAARCPPMCPPASVLNS